MTLSGYSSSNDPVNSFEDPPCQHWTGFSWIAPPLCLPPLPPHCILYKMSSEKVLSFIQILISKIVF